jgi:transposase
MHSLDSKNITITLCKKLKLSNKFNHFTFRDLEYFTGIPKSTIHRWVNEDKLYESKLKEKEEEKEHKDVKFFEIINFISYYIDEFPMSRLIDIHVAIIMHLKYVVSINKISRYLKLMKISKKKISLNNYTKTLEDKNKNIKEFINKVKNISNKDIICIDETYIKDNMVKQYGYCTKGQKLVVNNKISSLQYTKYSIIMAISNKKVIYFEIHKKKGINSVIYYNFMKKIMSRRKNKYFLMDNVPFHKSKKIKTLASITDNHLLFIPPYSPDCNPIENVFSSLKSNILYDNDNFFDIDTLKYCIKQYILDAKSYDNIYNNSFQK